MVWTIAATVRATPAKAEPNKKHAAKSLIARPGSCNECHTREPRPKIACRAEKKLADEKEKLNLPMLNL